MYVNICLVNICDSECVIALEKIDNVQLFRVCLVLVTT